MVQDFFAAGLSLGTRELLNNFFMFYIFRHHQRYPARYFILFYTLFFLAELCFCLQRGAFPSVREVYAFGALRELCMLIFFRVSASKLFFAIAFMAYTLILQNNIAYTLANYCRLPFAPENTAEILHFLSSVVIFYPLVCLLRRFSEYLENTTSTRLLTVANVVTYSFLLALAFQPQFGRSFNLEFSIIRLLVMLPGMLFLGFMLYLLQQLDTNMRLSKSVSTLQALYEKEHDYYSKALQNKEEAAKLQEYVQSSASHTLQLLDAKDYTAMEAHFNSMLYGAESLRHINLCGHQVVDAVVGYWQMRAWEKSISFNADIRVNAIHVDDLDLAIVLGNTLENAYTAASQPEVVSPSISLKLVSQNNLLVMTLENSYNGRWVASDGQYYSAKHDFLQPGTGISNVLLVVEKYDGYSKILPQSNTFLFQLVLTNRRPEE